MKIKQQEIAKLLGVSRSYWSLIRNQIKPVSYPMAEKLYRIFPHKDLLSWKQTTPQEIEATASNYLKEALNGQPSE